MAKQKRTSKSAVKKAAVKKPAKRAVTKTAKTSSVRKPTNKPTKVSAKTGAKAVAKPGTRRKQRVAISHYREEDFAADGLRAYAKYRDLGVAAASGGLAQAHVIRLIGPCNPKEVSKLHYHDAEFQLVYVLNGWVKTYMEGEGETLMRPGSCWTQPPRIKHLIRDYSDNCELLEVILPAEFKTVEIKG
jgi:mannose-6-phosphate isomerase-like protein (cupin superfamily)